MCMLILAKRVKASLIGWTRWRKLGLRLASSSGETHYQEEWGVERWIVSLSCRNPSVCVWEHPLLYSMALWDCCVFTLESGLIGGYEWAEGLQGDCEASGGGFCRTKKQRLAALDKNQTHSLVIEQRRRVGEWHSRGSIPYSLLHRHDSHSGQQYTSGLSIHTHRAHNVWDGLELLIRQMGTSSS